MINYITKKKSDGVDFDARYGAGLQYGTFDMDLNAGHSWDHGSATISYNYEEHSAIFGADRGYVTQYPANTAGIPFPVRNLNCSPGNVQLLGTNTTYALPYTTATAVANTANQCDQGKQASIYPEEHRYSVMAGVTEDFSDAINFDMRAFYMDRTLYQNTNGAFGGTELVAGFPGIPGLAYSPFFAAHKVTPSPFEFQTVTFAVGPNDYGVQNLLMHTWGVTPTLTAQLGHGWQLRALASYGESSTEQNTNQVDAAALANATAAGLFNPYDPASSNPQGLAAVENFATYGSSLQKLFNARLVLDGELFTLPGGAVKVAAGGEYNKETFDSRQGIIVPGTQNTGYPGLSINGTLIIPPAGPVPTVALGRNVEAAFGELDIPIFGKPNALPGLQELTFSASGRYDHYSDFGGPFDPRFGVTFKPIDWLKIRGTWGKSFVAPSLADNQQTQATDERFIPGLAFILPPAQLVASGKYPPVQPGQNTLIILGNAPNIQPQKATTESVGGDIQLPFVEGLDLHLTYWNIDYKGVIGDPPFIDQLNFWSQFGPPVIIVNPTQAQLNGVLAQATTVSGGCAPQPTCVYNILDVRKKNLGEFKISGLDFAADYSRRTDFGSVHFGLSGTYELNQEESAVVGGVYADQLAANTTRLRMRATAGAKVGSLYSEVALNHTSGYTLNPPVGTAQQQTSVSSFDVVDLFFSYAVNGQGLLKDLGLTLNVSNVFNRDPPAYLQPSLVPEQDGYTNGATVGRLVQFGIKKHF